MSKFAFTLVPRTCMAFARSCRGATAVEYALIAGLIALVIIGSITVLGTSLSGSFSNTTGAIDGS